MKLIFKDKQDAIDFRFNVLTDKIKVHPRPIEMILLRSPVISVEIRHLEQPRVSPAPAPR